MAPTPGILYVTMQPQPGLSIDQFHDWYNNEHGPTRLSIPSIFANGLRYRAVAPDDAAAADEPEFMAVYDVHSMPLLETPTYTKLRAHRSPREAATIARVHVKRSFYDLLHTKQSPAFQPLESLSDAAVAAGAVVTVAAEISLHATDAAAAEYQKWYTEEHAEMLAKVPGWLRSRLFKTSALGGASSPDGQTTTTTFFCLHDYAADNGLGGPEHKASMATPRRAQVFDRHVASKSRRTYNLFYVFGPAPRDLASLSRRLPPSSASFSSPADADADAPLTLRTDASSITSAITRPDGLRIPYRLEGSPSPAAPVVAFCNSLLTSYRMWDPFVAVLRRHRPDLRILRYDTRGRHAIPQPFRPATLDTVADDLDGLLAALRIDRLAALVGVSMGGATALNLSLRRPERVGRLVAADFNCAATAANTQAWRDRIAVARSSSSSSTGIKEVLAPQTVARWFHQDTPKETAEWMTEMVAENDVEGFAHSCTALWDYDLRPDMPACRVPALLVVGEADGGGVLAKTMDGFKGLLGKDGTELRVVPRTGHLPMCENPEAFWEAIRDFI